MQSLRTGWTPIHFACCSLAILLSLIEPGANPDISIHISTTPLMLVCLHGFEMLVEILVNLNLSVNAQIQVSDTPLKYAVQYSDNTITWYYLLVLMSFMLIGIT